MAGYRKSSIYSNAKNLNDRSIVANPQSEGRFWMSDDKSENSTVLEKMDRCENERSPKRNGKEDSAYRFSYATSPMQQPSFRKPPQTKSFPQLEKRRLKLSSSNLQFPHEVYFEDLYSTLGLLKSHLFPKPVGFTFERLTLARPQDD